MLHQDSLGFPKTKYCKSGKMSDKFKIQRVTTELGWEGERICLVLGHGLLANKCNHLLMKGGTVGRKATQRCFVADIGLDEDKMGPR